MMNNRRNHFLAPFCLILLVASGASATTWHIPADFADIQAGLDAAAPGDSVLVASGTYSRDLQISPTSNIRTRYIMPSGVVLAGATGNPEDVILDGQGHGRVMTCVQGGSDIVVQDLTITGGSINIYAVSNDGGGGFTSWECDVTLENCVIRQNASGDRSGAGGGAYLRGGHVLVRGCLFLENTMGTITGDSGGLRLGGVTGSVEDCVFLRNTASSAGGLNVGHGPGSSPSDVTVTRCRFENNTAWGFSGAATVSQWCTARFEKCFFLGNEAVRASGGAMRFGDADVTVQSCRFEDNTAATEGGAIYCAYWWGPSSTFKLRDCTLVNNTAGVAGGAIHILSGSEFTGWNTDFAGNAAPDGPDGAVVDGASAILQCCLTGPELWAGTITLDNAGCVVANEPLNWGSVKALFR